MSETLISYVVIICGYSTLTKALSWQEAKTTCENENQSHLLPLNVVTEMDSLLDFIKDTDVSSVWIDQPVDIGFTWIDDTVNELCIASVTDSGKCVILRDGKLQAIPCYLKKEYACKISGHTSCDKGHLVTWDQAKQRCQASDGELLLQQDDLKNLCSEKENGVWVGLRKTATVRKSQNIKNVIFKSTQIKKSEQFCSTLNIQLRTVTADPCDNKKRFFCYVPTVVKFGDEHSLWLHPAFLFVGVLCILFLITAVIFGTLWRKSQLKSDTKGQQKSDTEAKDIYVRSEPKLHQVAKPELQVEPSLSMQQMSSFPKTRILPATPGSSPVCVDTRTLPSAPGVYTEIQEHCVHSYSNAKRCLDGYVLPQCEHCGLQQAAEQI